MTRTLGAAFRLELEKSASSEHGVELLAINGTIFVANDTVDYSYTDPTYGLQTFVGFPFVIEYISDDDSMPHGKLTIQNVDRAVGDVVQTLFAAVSLQITLLSSADFAAPVSGLRSPIATPTVEYVAKNLSLRSIQVDAMQVSGTITSYDDNEEPWPSIRTTPDVFPGLDA